MVVPNKAATNFPARRTLPASPPCSTRAASRERTRVSNPSIPSNSAQLLLPGKAQGQPGQDQGSRYRHFRTWPRWNGIPVSPRRHGLPLHGRPAFGSAAGEKLTRAIERGLAENCPRHHRFRLRRGPACRRAFLSLMQMAKDQRRARPLERSRAALHFRSSPTRPWRA